jgi:hypothetical protein
VASDTATTPAAEGAPQFGETVKFHRVFAAEIKIINKRRASSRDPRGAIELEAEARDISGEPVLRPSDNSSVVGLALSGGGTRSAAFCLGVLQALNEKKVLDKSTTCRPSLAAATLVVH